MKNNIGRRPSLQKDECGAIGIDFWDGENCKLFKVSVNRIHDMETVKGCGSTYRHGENTEEGVVKATVPVGWKVPPAFGKKNALEE